VPCAEGAVPDRAKSNVNGAHGPACAVSCLNGALGGAGITFVHKSGFSTSIKYIGEYRGDYISNGVLGELRFVF
jgi:hypothetical protein